ncbi:hypothetical protein [Methylocystis parvus]|uniref:Uncharacterized protein n=1 Tax=Methylocystis parvus TaxID=134 RepID=A0A6B8M3P0_9HYPH|nr:hypothetical protein [Methylocystis parvus]QGM96996.1 hypothetical protein F7D14_05590 [Methylocystis parvus]WBJ99111.1 hypothetical protein MMG94_14030 [Methylocystis parvus OBBP]
MKWPVAALVWAGCAGAIVTAWRARAARALMAKPVNMTTLALSLCFGLTLCALGGEGHFFYTMRDWLVRDAVLADLVRNGVAASYRHDETLYMLRAPLGMYLLPSLIGRMSGLYAAHLALLVQNATIIGAICYFIAGVAKANKAAILLVFIGFSGLDILPILVAEAIEMAKGEPFMPFNHIEWWGEYFSDIRMQYSSHLALLFWALNHMAPGWLFGILSLLYVRGAVAFVILPVSFAATLLWSPLAMLGAAPFLAYFALELFPRRLFAREILIAVASSLCFLPIAVYLMIDNGGVAKEWLVLREGFLQRYLLHMLVEIPQAAIVLYAWRIVEPCDRRLLALALGLLLVLPLYSVGLYNDFAMRASIAPLFVLSFAFARIAVLTPRDNSRFATAISTIVLISAATPLVEVKTAMTTASFDVSDCNFITAWRKNEITAAPGNYLARIETIPTWLMSPQEAAPLSREDRKCWPDHPLLEEGLK